MKHETMFLALTPTTLRLRIETTIEKLLALLYKLDGDADLEPEPIEEQHDREYDFAEFGSCDWSNDPDVAQEGERCHGHVTA